VLSTESLQITCPNPAERIAGVVGLRAVEISSGLDVSSQDLHLFYHRECPVAMIIGRLRLS
jgi:hypothetical protein